MKKPSHLICELAFIIGYAQLIPTRSFRRTVARTEIHRSWLAGNQGNIGEPDGVLYRAWHTNRKHHKNATIKQVWRNLRGYYGLYGSKESRFLITAIMKDMLMT